MLLLLLLIIVIIVIFCYTKSNLISSNTVSTNIKNIKNEIKSGDILLVANNEDYIKRMYLLIRQGKTTKVIDIDKNGKINLNSIEKVVKKIKDNVYVLSLLRPLTNLQENSIKTLLMRNYAGMGNSNCVLKYNNVQYFYNCSTYLINIMARAGILGIGSSYDCINNFDPKCLQKLYNTSIFINGKLFSDTPFLIKAHQAE